MTAEPEGLDFNRVAETAMRLEGIFSWSGVTIDLTALELLDHPWRAMGWPLRIGEEILFNYSDRSGSLLRYSINLMRGDRLEVESVELEPPDKLRPEIDASARAKLKVIRASGGSIEIVPAPLLLTHPQAHPDIVANFHIRSDVQSICSRLRSLEIEKPLRFQVALQRHIGQLIAEVDDWATDPEALQYVLHSVADYGAAFGYSAGKAEREHTHRRYALRGVANSTGGANGGIKTGKKRAQQAEIWHDQVDALLPAAIDRLVSADTRLSAESLAEEVKYKFNGRRTRTIAKYIGALISTGRLDLQAKVFNPKRSQ